MKSLYEKRYKYGLTDYLKGKHKNTYRVYYISLILFVILISTILNL